MTWGKMVLVAASLGLLGSAARAAYLSQTQPDCPAAFEPYSADTMLVDLLVVPETKAVVEKDAPQLMVAKDFGAILSPRILPIISAAQKQQLDDDLGRIKVTSAAAKLRCARYDSVPPDLPAITRPTAILVFSKTTGFRDEPSITASNAMLAAIGARHGWQTVFSENGAIFTPELLRKFRAVVWSNVSGDVLTNSQRNALRDFVESGGGFVGIHGSGGDPKVLWDWYRDVLIGAQFVGHPLHPQFQQATVIVEKDAGRIAKGLGRSWSMTDEWYSFKASPRLTGAHIIARLDEGSYPGDAGEQTFGSLRMGADHPIAWTRCVGKGRSFYSAIGHLPAAYADAHVIRLYDQALSWASDPEATCP